MAYANEPKLTIMLQRFFEKPYAHANVVKARRHVAKIPVIGFMAVLYVFWGSEF